MEFLMGAAGAAAALALFGAGVWAGRRWPEGHAAEGTVQGFAVFRRGGAYNGNT